MENDRNRDLFGEDTSGAMAHDIFDFELIISLSNLLNAWREFKRKKGKRQDVKLFGFKLEDNLFALHEELKNGTYTPSDFDQHFISDSYSCRFNKGAHRGVDRLEKFMRQASQNYSRPAYALKCDVKKFFDSIDQEILFDLIKKEIKDKRTLDLIEKIIKSFEKDKGKGLPLGNVTSQLFANIYLNELDQFIKHQLKQKYYLRYCDDFVIVGDNLEDLNNLIKPIDDFLNSRLKLFLHPDKVDIRKLTQGIDFLGYVILPHYRVLRNKTKKRVLVKVNSRNLLSYLGVLSHCRGYKISQEIKALATLTK